MKQVNVAAQRTSRALTHILSGFTLVELLVVAAVVALVASVLLPVFQRAHDTAHKASCQSNLKQLGAALNQYQQDNDEKSPIGIFNPGLLLFPRQSQYECSHDGAGQGWAGQVYMYVKSPGVFVCPDDKTPGVPATATARPLYPVSYALNSNIAYTPSLDQMSASSRTVFLFEVSGTSADITHSPEASGNMYSPGGNAIYWNNQKYSNSAQAETGYVSNTQVSGVATRLLGDNKMPQYAHPTGRHEGFANYLLADGHVQSLRGSGVSGGLDAAAPVDAEGNDLAAGTANSHHLVTFSIK